MPSIEKLEALLAKSPDDAFLNYGLAMALVSAGRSGEARARFERVLDVDPGYLAAYFQMARLLASTGDAAAARAALRAGIGRARTAGDAHAEGEMAAFLDELGGG
jgi:predicted Zn-dependent protease